MAGAGATRPGAAPRSTQPSQELLDDLCSRFVLNVPEEELQSFERIIFLVEQAHWFYEDNAMEQTPGLKSMSLRDFAALMFQSCAALRPYMKHIDGIYKDFTTYKIRVPVTGAIILDEAYERCLLVKGWKAGASWSFPRGKKNKDEEDHRCAVREVWEETGFDISGLIKVDQFVESTIAQQRMRLYVIAGIKDDTLFEPQTKKEISEIAWHRIDELPMAGTETTSHNRGSTGMKYFMVWPFVGALMAWIGSNRPSESASDVQGKSETVWKVKSGSGPGASTGAGILAAPTTAPSLPTGGSTVEPKSAPLLPTPVTAVDAQPAGVVADQRKAGPVMPGNSFRNFQFDASKILHPFDHLWGSPELQESSRNSNVAVQ